MLKYLPKRPEFSRTVNTDPIKKNVLFLKWLIQVSSLWPESRYGILTALSCLGMFSMTVITAVLTWYFIQNIRDFPMQHLSIVAAFVQMLMKMVTLIMYKKKLQEILQKIWCDFLPVTAAANVENKIRRLATLNRRLIYGVLAFAIVAASQVLDMEFLMGSQKLPFPMTFLPDPAPSPSYELTYMWQWLTTAMTAYTGICIDLLFVTFVFTCIAQFQIINSNLKLFGSTSYHSKAKFVSFFLDTKQIPTEFLDKYLLNKCIAQHNMVTRVCEEVGEVFQYIMLTQVLTSVVTLCLSSFGLKEHPENALKWIPLPTVIFGQLTLYCWFGEQLTYHAGSCAFAAFDSVWYDASDVQLQKALILIIQQSNKEIVITAGGFTNMCLNTLVQVLKFCVSVYTLMGKVMDKSHQS